MSDQPNGSETEQTAQTAETAGGSVNQEQHTETAGTLEERMKAMEAALRKANAEAAKYRKQASAFEEAEQKRKEAEMSETDRLKAQYEKAAAELQALKLNELKRQAAAKHNLPEVLALRLQGTTLEELEADAETLSKTLPKQSPKIGATNPGAAPAQTTDDELKAKLWGRTKDVFSRAWAEQHGGGVFTVQKEED
jgi:hypothetical protein